MSIEFSMEAYGVSVRDTGARGDGTGDDSAAIQKALDGPHSLVTIPEGKYVLGETLKVGSGKTIVAHPQAVLQQAPGAGRDVHSFLLTNADHKSGNGRITVRGGIWDGNNEHNPRGKDGDFNGYTGVPVNFVNVNHLALTDLTVRNPESFSIRIGEVNHFTIENIAFDHPSLRPNQDGVHVGGFCEDGVIRNLRALTPHSTNDDMVALNADDDVERVINLGMKLGPIRNIHVEGLSAENAYTFLRLLSQEQPVHNIRVRNMWGACRNYAVNLNRWRFPVGKGNISNVHISDIRVSKASDARDNPLIPVTLSERNVIIERYLRSPEDTHAGPTLVVENGVPNDVGLTLSSREQMDRVAADSTGIDGTVKPATMPDGATFHHASLKTAPAGRLVLAKGGFERLAINVAE